MITNTAYSQSKFKGLIVALTMMVTWLAVLLLGIFDAQPFAQFIWSDLIWIVITAWLYTGLFITAHEAMHNLVVPKSLLINKRICQMALLFYAGLSYKKLLQGHIAHHAHPSTTKDPDYWPYQNFSFVRWYLRFLFEYFSWSSLIIMATVYNIAAHLIHIEESQLLIMWILPQLLSSIQLFYFGTYLPHRPNLPYEGSGLTRARSNHYSYVFSLLSCFHFGCHYEHHAYPYIPWWDLYKVKNQKISL